jgi:crossover junction endodeoxyribonuclease RuvC
VRVLGVDPGLLITGYGIVDCDTAGAFKVAEAGFVKTRRRDDIGTRIYAIHSHFNTIIEKNKPAVLVLEALYSHYRHPTTAILMGHARGAVVLSAARAHIPLISYGATDIKKAITGNGRASKSQVQRAIQNLLGLAQIPAPEDVADGLALALGHLYSIQLKKRGLRT